ncbi:hypothetical protein ACFL4G_11830 [Thermodesulfobacteriota bacterium]
MEEIEEAAAEQGARSRKLLKSALAVGMTLLLMESLVCWYFYWFRGSPFSPGQVDVAALLPLFLVVYWSEFRKSPFMARWNRKRSAYAAVAVYAVIIGILRFRFPFDALFIGLTGCIIAAHYRWHRRKPNS